jgi:hypothetical protein
MDDLHTKASLNFQLAHRLQRGNVKVSKESAAIAKQAAKEAKALKPGSK